MARPHQMVAYCICGCWVAAGDADGVDDGWCYGCEAGEQAHRRPGADCRLVEAAAAAAAALAATAFRAGWPYIPTWQPQWLLVQALATAALGDAAAGGELAQAFLCGEQAPRDGRYRMKTATRVGRLRREEIRHRAERGRFALVLDADWRDVSYPDGATLRAVTESQLRDLDSPRARRGHSDCRG